MSQHKVPSVSRYEMVKNGSVEGFLMGVKTHTWYKPEKFSGVDLFILKPDGNYVRFYFRHDPYFWVVVGEEDQDRLTKKIWSKGKDKFGNGTIKNVEYLKKHVTASVGEHFYHKVPCLKVITYFPNSVSELRDILVKGKIVRDRKDIRESEIPFHYRVMIDKGLNPGKYYKFTIEDSFASSYKEVDKLELPDIKEKCTFDIEIKKKPIKKPQIGDPVTLIGYRYKEDGFMINNLDIHCGVEIEPFWMGVKDGKATPLTNEEAEVMKVRGRYKPVYFNVTNVETEREVITSWKDFLVDEIPVLIGGYNSDRFDWNQLVENGKAYDISFDEYFDRYEKFDRAWDKDGSIILDAYNFIERDSYLPKGSRGLKEVSKKLLGIEGMEIDHEENVRILDKLKNWTDKNSLEYDPERAKKEVQHLAYYCASDVYTTSILLNDQVSTLDLSLSSILPMNVFETARKKRGSMVELMVLKHMYGKDMIAPNKVVDREKLFFNPKSDSFYKKKEVFQEVTDKGNNALAKCLCKEMIEQKCSECSSSQKCLSLIEDPIMKNKHFHCEKNDEIIIGMPMTKLPIKEYKFEGAYVDVFNVGIFKDDCPISFPINKNYMEKISKKMKVVLMKKKKDVEEKGGTIKDFNKYLQLIDNGFKEVLDKISKDGDGDLYRGLINLVHVDVASMYPSLITNYGFQPHAVVSKLICDSCDERSKEGEPCCWIEMPWVSIYEVYMLPPKMEQVIFNKVTSDPELLKMEAEDRVKEIDKIVKKAIEKGMIAKPRRSNAAFRNNETARFCQKAFKYFVDIIIDFKGKRLKYKYGEKDTKKEVENLEKSWQEQITPEKKEKISVIQKKIDPLKVKVNDYRKNNVGKYDLQTIKGFVKEINALNLEVGTLIDAWMGEIPSDLKRQIDNLEKKKLYNRNAQLTFKVILNAVYGWLWSVGARLKCIEVAGCTTKAGQKLILWVIDYIKPFSLPIEVDSLDYDEEIVLKDPQGTIRVMSIGKFVDMNIDKNGISRINQERGVDYSPAIPGWTSLSVTEDGKMEWKPVTSAIRQKTERDVIKVTTPFGSVKTTESHSIFQNIMGKIEPFIVKDVKDQYITHACHIPPAESVTKINMARESGFSPMFVFVPVGDEHSLQWDEFPVSKLRLGLYNDNRFSYHRVPIEKFDGIPREDYIVGSLKGMKLPAVIRLTEEVAELIGWYASEGTSGIYNGKVAVDISQNPGENLERIKELCGIVGKNVFGHNYEPHYSLSDRRAGTMRVGIDNTFFYHLFNSMGCGKNSFMKRIPSEILSAPERIKYAFLRGYFKGDGTCKGKRMQFSTASDGLRDDLFVLGKQLGYIFTTQDYLSSTSGNVMHNVNFSTMDNWERGSRSHYQFNAVGRTIGLKSTSIERTKKTGEYVYDISVEKNNNFVSANGGIICHNTDGVWDAIPKDFPLDAELTIISKDGKEKKETINFFNSIINDDVKITFINGNNYEWNEEEKKYFNKPKCDLQFDYDGPFSTFIVQGMKKYIAYMRDEKDPTRQKIEEIKGSDTKRKGEIPFLNDMEEKMNECFKNGSTYDECYGSAAEIVKAKLNDLLEKKVLIQTIYESRDIKSVKKVVNVSELFLKLEEEGKYDPSKVPSCACAIRSSALEKDVKKRLSTAIGGLKTKYQVGCFRMADMGIDVEDGDTVQWIISKYPESTGVSQCTIPTNVFELELEDMKKYLKRWTGYDPSEQKMNKTFAFSGIDGEGEKVETEVTINEVGGKSGKKMTKEEIIADIVDWNYYLDRFYKKINRSFVKFYENQKSYVSINAIKESGIDKVDFKTIASKVKERKEKKESTRVTKREQEASKMYKLDQFI